MSARSLRYLHEKSGADECHLAIFIISGILIYLIIGDYARFVANTILVAVPILLTYVYPDEKPPSDILLYYWFIYIITTLFFDPKPEDKGSYYWIKMLLLILLIVFPGEADITISKQHKNENNDQEKIMVSSNGDLRKEETSDQRPSDKEADSLGTTLIKSSALPTKIKMISVTNVEKIPIILEEKSLSTQQNQIPSEKGHLPPLVPEMKLQLDSETESSIHKNESQITLAQKSSVSPENKAHVFVEESQIASPKKAELITVRKRQIIRPLKKSQVFQPEKFTDTSTLKSEIIPIQDPLIAFTEKFQNSPPSELQTAHEEMPQLAPLKISRSRQDKTTFAKESQIFPVREIQPIYSKEHGTTYSKIAQTVPKNEARVISLNEPQTTVIQESQFPPLRKPEITHFNIVKIIPVKNKKRTEEFPATSVVTEFVRIPAREHQITHLKESEGSRIKESKIGPDKEIQTASVKKPEDICSKKLEIFKMKKFKELQDVPMKISRTILPDRKTDEAHFAPLKSSTTLSIKESQNILNKETEEFHFVPKHELKAAFVEEPHTFSPELQVSAVPVKEISQKKEYQDAPKFETESVIRNSSAMELQVSLKESDAVTETETQINRANKIIDTPEQQSPTIHDVCIDLKKNVDVETEISQDISEGKKSGNAITWVATGKTVVTTQYARTEQPNELQ